jgi:hypothetical protein
MAAPLGKHSGRSQVWAHAVQVVALGHSGKNIGAKAFMIRPIAEAQIAQKAAMITIAPGMNLLGNTSAMQARVPLGKLANGRRVPWDAAMARKRVMSHASKEVTARTSLIPVAWRTRQSLLQRRNATQCHARRSH